LGTGFQKQNLRIILLLKAGLKCFATDIDPRVVFDFMASFLSQLSPIAAFKVIRFSEKKIFNKTLPNGKLLGRIDSSDMGCVHSKVSCYHVNI